MGNIPEYKRAPILRPVIDTTGSARAQVAQAFGQVGASASEAFQTYKKIEDERLKIDQQNWLNKAVPVMEREVQAAFDNWKKSYRDDPLNKENFLRERLEGINGRYMREANGPLARKILGETSQRYFEDIYNQGRRWSDEAFADNTLRTSQNGLENLTTRAYRQGHIIENGPDGKPMVLPNPAILHDLMKESQPLLNAITLTTNPQFKERLEKDFQRKNAIQMFEGIIDQELIDPQNPNSQALDVARQLLGSGEFDEVLGANGINTIDSMLKRRMNFHKAKAKDYTDLKRKDPWKFLTKVGEPFSEIDIKTPSARDFEKRIAERDYYNKKYNIDLPYLTNYEISFIDKEFSKLSFDQQEPFFDSIRELPEEDFFEIKKQISKKLPSYSSIFSMMRHGGDYSKDRAKEIYNGLNLLKKDPVSGKPTVKINSQELNDFFDKEIGRMISDPDQESSARQAYTAIYANRYSDQENRKSFPDIKKIMSQSLTSIVGPRVNVGISKIFGYQKEDGSFASEQEMKDLYRSMSLSNIKKTHGDIPRLPISGRAFDISAARQALELIYLGQNKYNIRFRNQTLVNKEGVPFTFDFTLFSKTKPTDETSLTEDIRLWLDRNSPGGN